MVAQFILVLLMIAPAAACKEHEGLAHLTSFEENGKWGYRDKQGAVVIPPKFEIAQDFSHGIAAVVDPEGWAYINSRGEVLLRPMVVDNGPDYFKEGLARFVQNGKTGFFDLSGRIVIAPKFDFAWPFAEGLTAFCQGCQVVRVPNDEEGHSSVEGDKWGFADRNGTPLIAPRYEIAESFHNGRAHVKVDGQWRYVNRKGQFSLEGPKSNP